MPIVSHTIDEDQTYPSGRRELRWHLVDHLGNIYPRRIVPFTGDPATVIAEDYTRTDTVNEDREIERAQKLILVQGSNPLTLAQNAQYNSTKRMARRLIMWMMSAGKSRDRRVKNAAVQIVLAMEPLLVYLNQQYATNAALASWLSSANRTVTEQQVQRMKIRVNRILQASVKNELIAADAESEDWGEPT